METPKGIHFSSDLSVSRPAASDPSAGPTLILADARLSAAAIALQSRPGDIKAHPLLGCDATDILGAPAEQARRWCARARRHAAAAAGIQTADVTITVETDNNGNAAVAISID